LYAVLNPVELFGFENKILTANESFLIDAMTEEAMQISDWRSAHSFSSAAENGEYLGG
jgi:hypothetical protein